MTQILTDGESTYLYSLTTFTGAGRLAQDASEMEYFLGDAAQLRSRRSVPGTLSPQGIGEGDSTIRQMVTSEGDITLEKSYTPFGEVLNESGTGESVYGYTGEVTDPSGLVYLRARYYLPDSGIFTKADNIYSNPSKPVEINKYIYVWDNPINLYDPTGNTPIVIFSGHNDRDLTSWLFRELRVNAFSPYVIRMYTMRNGNNPFEILKAFNAFKLLVQDRSKWDFKHKILSELQANSFVLYHGNSTFEYRWYERSVAGNIHYGYIGRAAGFSSIELHGGASYAEITDPSHKERGETCCCIPNLFGGCLYGNCGYINPNWQMTFFDDPEDYNAIDVGIAMYDTYGRYLTWEGYQAMLSNYGSTLASLKDPLNWEYKNHLGSWPYEIGHFNGPFERMYEAEIHKLLF